jgi:hypothetical protein
MRSPAELQYLLLLLLLLLPRWQQALYPTVF